MVPIDRDYLCSDDDGCPFVTYRSQFDTDSDRFGDACDAGNDGVGDAVDPSQDDWKNKGAYISCVANALETPQ
jgi:hypothetical protein